LRFPLHAFTSDPFDNGGDLGLALLRGVAAPAGGQPPLPIAPLRLALPRQAFKALVARAIMRSRMVGFRAIPRTACAGPHVDAIHRARLDAELAASAFRFDYSVHVFSGAENRVHRTSLNAFGATDAFVLVDDGDNAGFNRPAVRIERLWRALKKMSQRVDRLLTAGWTAVDIGIARGKRLRIGAAPSVPATPALRLRQEVVEAVDDFLSLYIHI
jgi:hypothetical protein